MAVARKLLWLGPVVGLVACAWHNQVLQPWTLDDAYISFRYAESFARGDGLVYNPGERVEGYTTFLWVFLLGIGNALGAETRVLAKTLGVLFAAGTLGLLAFAHRVVPALDARAGAVAAALVGSCGVFSAWVMPGMEVPLVAFLITATGLAFARGVERGHGWVAGVLGALAMMARPDSIVWVGVMSGWAALVAWRRRDARLLQAPLAVVGVYGPYFVWRFAYYGWLLPNTFYAKVGSTGAQLWRGLEYVTDFAVPAAPFLVGFAVLVPIVRSVWRDSPVVFVYAGGVLLHGLYVISVGGDVMPAFRFFAGVLPMAGLVAGAALVRLPRVWPALVAGLVGFNLWQFAAHPDLHPRIERGVVGLRGEEVGLWMRDNLDPDGLLATNTAGSVPYFSGLRTIDMLGLNDAHIAHREMPRMGRGRAGHEKADGAYVFAREPDYVHFGSARGRAEPVFRSDRELYRQPGFKARYELKRFKLPSGARLTLWVKR